MIVGASGVAYDAQGFLLTNTQKINNIDKNVEEILRLLKLETQIMLRQRRSKADTVNVLDLTRASNQPAANDEASNRGSHTRDRLPRDNSQNTRHANDANGAQNSSTRIKRRKPQNVEDIIDDSQSTERKKKRRGNNSGGVNNAEVAGANAAEGRRANRQSNRADTDIVQSRINRGNNAPDTENRNNNSDQRRDEKGRFTGASPTVIDRIDKLVDKFSAAMPDTHGVDPTVEAMRELGGILSPFKKIIGLGGRGVRWLRRRRSRSPVEANPEHVPRQTRQHNTRVEKILKKILDRLRGRSGASGGGLFGGLGGLLGSGGALGGGLVGALLARGGSLLKGGGKGIAKLLKFGRGVPVIGAALSALGFMDWKKQSTAQKGGTVGGTVGGVAGAALGSVVGPVGTVIGGMAGAWIGDKLGSIVAPYIKDWTDSLIKADLPTKMQNGWNGLVNYVQNGFNKWFATLPQGVQDAAKTLDDKAKQASNWFEDKLKQVGNFFSGLLGGGGAVAGMPSIGSFLTGNFGGGGASGSFGGGSAIGSSAADYALKHAAAQSLSKCAEYVNNALQEQGLKASGNGKDVAKNLLNDNKGKVQQIAYDENYVPQIGDVMSMPSNSKSKHNYGHVAIYTAQGWVSDFKQGNKYGNTAAPNADYYNEIKSGKISPTVVRMLGSGQPSKGGRQSELSKNQQIVYKTARAMGESHNAAMALAANFSGEALHDPSNTTGDNGRAQGIAQWHSDRANAIKKQFGKLPKDMTVEEQTVAALWEIDNNPAYAKTKQALSSDASAEQIIGTLVKNYERPANADQAINQRIGFLKKMDLNVVPSSGLPIGIARADVPAATANSIPSPKEALNALPRAQSPAAKAKTPAATANATKPNIKQPHVEAAKVPVSSPPPQKVLVMNQNSDNIGQDLLDRALAHAVTGGIGKMR